MSGPLRTLPNHMPMVGSRMVLCARGTGIAVLMTRLAGLYPVGPDDPAYLGANAVPRGRVSC
jgi:hypothetical protein